VNSKLKIFCVLFSAVLVIALFNFQINAQKSVFTSIFNHKVQDISECCQVITTCCEETSSEVEKCLYCNINDKQTTIVNPLKFKFSNGNPLKLIVVKNALLAGGSHFYKNIFSLRQNCIIKIYQINRPQTYPYLENIHTTILLI
jgi:hypothetical protein